MRREVIFEVDLAPTDVADRLRAVIATPPTLRSLLSEPSLGLPYVGEVDESRFSARRGRLNTLKVLAHGLITPVGHGSRVALRLVGPPRGLVATLCGALLVGAVVMLSIGEPWAALIFAAASALVAYAGIVQPQREADAMARVLGGACSSESVGAARSLARTV
jgi:hypothetical protein